MKTENRSRGVERLFPFVLRSRALLVGRETLRRSKGSLHFLLITRDLPDPSRAAVLEDFSHYPVVQHFSSEDLEQFFGVKGARLIGFKKSGLAQSIYAELKQYRINKPAKIQQMEEVSTPTKQKPGLRDQPGLHDKVHPRPRGTSSQRS